MSAAAAWAMAGAAWAFVAAAIYDRRTAPNRPGGQCCDFQRIAPHIQRAAELAEEIRELDDLRITLEITAPRERARPVRLEWANVNGEKLHRASIFADGQQSTAALLRSVEAERAELLRALLREVNAAYHGDAVTQANTETRRRCIETEAETDAE